MPDIVELDGSPPRVAIERVVPALSSPLIDGPVPLSSDPIEPTAALEPLESPSVGPGHGHTGSSDQVVPESGLRPRRSDLELAAVVAVAISLAGGDMAAGVLCGAALAVTTAFRRVPFSFAEGFLGYRPDMGWPHGVQEDDDVHWNWKSRKPASKRRCSCFQRGRLPARTLRTRWPAWNLAPEVTFAVYGERGSIDVLALHAGRRALLVIELKTELVDFNELLGTLDRKRRLSRRIAGERGWDPLTVSTWLIISDRRTNRRRLEAHRVMVRSALPDDRRTIHRWLRDPVGAIAGLSFWTESRTEGLGRAPRSVRRVNAAAASVGDEPIP